MQRPFLPFCLLFWAIVGASISFAQAPVPPPLDAKDTQFVLLAAQDGETEVRLGGIAAERGTLPAVKQFGAMMATDHTIANGQLKALAIRRGVQIPAVLDPEHQKLVDAWTKKDLPTFDRAYVDEMISAHKTAISAFQEASKRTTDTEVRVFVETAIITLQHHLQMAETIKTGLK